MLAITTKLKRIRYTRNVMQIVIWVVFFPLIILMWLGKLGEFLSGFIIDGYYQIESKIIKRFKWDDVARKQYKENPDKFKD